MDRSGTHLLVDGTLVPGYAEVRDGTVEVVLDDPPAGADPALVVPPFVNAHTHVGDAALKPVEMEGSIEEIFAPPDGQKHVHLRKLTDREAVEGMVEALSTMRDTGTCRFWDFREGGIEGVEVLSSAADRVPEVEAGVLGRPAGMTYDAEEIDALCSSCPGLGLSAVRDFARAPLSKIVDHVHREGGLLAFHTSEAEREPIEPVLSLDPDLLVHLCEATPDDLERVVAEDIAVACCPRSNARFGLTPPVPELVDLGGDVHLGTDNAMFQWPDMLQEVVFTLQRFDGLDAADVLSMAVRDPFGDDPAGFAGPGVVERAVVVAFEGADPGRALREGRVEVRAVLG